MSDWTKPKMIEAIHAAWSNLATHKHGSIPYFADTLDRALTEEERAERAHRAVGRRWTDGQARYRLAVRDTAKLFVLQHALESACGQVKPPRTWQDYVRFAGRCALAFAIGEMIRDAKLTRQAFSDRRFDAIDYARDVAAGHEN